jgi:hypothetical protein
MRFAGIGGETVELSDDARGVPIVLIRRSINPRV